MSKRTRLSVESLGDRCLPSFSPATSFPVDANPQAVVTADFNNDGKLDLATSNYDDATGDGTLSVLLGNGDGSFQPARTSATGQYPFSLAVGDFNADGKGDLATANYDYSETNDVSILLGNGDGTFAPAVALNITDAYSWSIAAGDMNADGKLDLVVTSDDEFLGGYLSVLLGHGDGSFAATTYGPYFGQLFSPVLADVSGDGRVDVTVAAWQANTIKVFLGDGDGFGDGTLQEFMDFPTGWVDSYGPDSLDWGDFNTDAVPDLVATSSDGSVSMLFGYGDGTFQTAHAFALDGAGCVKAIDVNGDRKRDLVVINRTSPGAVSVLLGDGHGGLSMTSVTTSTGGVPGALVMGDFNGDGRPDAATANAGSNNVAVLVNDGIWDVSPPPPPPPSVTIGDRTVAERNTGTTAASFTVTLSAASSQPITVAYATGNGTAGAGSDYQAASGTLTFAPGETTKTITVPIIGDRSGEPNETFVVNLSSPTNAVIADGQGVGTIVDDEPRISISDVTKKEGNSKKTTSFTFTVTLSAPYDQPVTVSFKTTDGTATIDDGDYVAKTGTITFNPGETSKTIAITAKGDKKREANEYLYLDLSGNSSNSFFTKNRGLGTILNDD